MSGVWPFVLVAVSMALQDAFGTLTVIAEARGRDNLAGLLDAGSDAARLLTTLYCVGPSIRAGHMTGQSLELLATMMFVSYWGTRYWTRFGRRIKVEA